LTETIYAGAVPFYRVGTLRRARLSLAPDNLGPSKISIQGVYTKLSITAANWDSVCVHQPFWVLFNMPLDQMIHTFSIP